MNTVAQFAKRHRLHRSRVHQLIAQGRVPGAVRISAKAGTRGRWYIPLNSRIDPPPVRWAAARE
jgi:hypothetical protein